ncbi:MAG: S41 family peptidase [Gemmataceae bacterium]|nr:S41 family peptidase [Gemmata sp.]MDW8199145.1 S41 family peptidase [Gemmataceae bacterium]
MVGITAVGLVVVSVAAPVPAPEPPPTPKLPRAEQWKAHDFARIVYHVADQVAANYVRPVEVRDLIKAAARGLYDECRDEIPEQALRAIDQARNPNQLTEALAEILIQLADRPALTGPRALYAAINGFRFATDPACQLVSPRTNTFASIDMDFGIGIELEGVSGKAWILYRVEYQTALGMYPPTGWLDPPRRAEHIPPPTGVPWRITRVIPESPAQKAGLRPGDIITHFNGQELTGHNVHQLFAQFAFPPQRFDPQTGVIIPPDRTLTIRRGNQPAFSVAIRGQPYTPASAFGVMRTSDEKWDCMLDRQYKIGYLRLGAIEANLDVKVAEMLADLDRRGCRALILDLRWCPGGYVDPGVRIAGMFLPADALIAQMKYRNPHRAGNQPEIRNNFPNLTRYTTYPLVVLIGQETTGGGELIAAALRDNNRCVLMGQRSVGRAWIQNLVDGGFGGLQFKVTTGESFRPNGQPRQRKPDSGPLDPWGLKPDEGLEVPVTKDKSLQLREWAELHALRPSDSNEALDFDDPARDPFRLQALDYLRQLLDEKR